MASSLRVSCSNVSFTLAGVRNVEIVILLNLSICFRNSVFVSHCKSSTISRDECAIKGIKRFVSSGNF
jgi:hypothetical protein